MNFGVSSPILKGYASGRAQACPALVAVLSCHPCPGSLFSPGSSNPACTNSWRGATECLMPVHFLLSKYLAGWVRTPEAQGHPMSPLGEEVTALPFLCYSWGEHATSACTSSQTPQYLQCWEPEDMDWHRLRASSVKFYWSSEAPLVIISYRCLQDSNLIAGLFYGSHSPHFYANGFQLMVCEPLELYQPLPKKLKLQESRFSTDLILPPEALYFHEKTFRNSQMKNNKIENHFFIQ